MSDTGNSRVFSSSPLSASPNRGPSLSRPHWPWSTYTRYRNLSSQSSLQSGGGSAQGATSSHSSSWDPNHSASPMPWSTTGQGQARQNTGSTMLYSNNLPETTRHWTFTAFEWVVRDAAKLRDYVEGHELEGGDKPSPVQDDFELLKESPVIGDGKFKLELIVRSLCEGGSENAAKARGLSLYITSLMLDFAHPEYEMSASMMTAIKCQDDRLGERGARAEWVWEFWQNDWVFRQESEVWECPLPSLSALLENTRIHETDSFVVCVQVHCPVGPVYPQQPSAYFVPRELLDGLEASLDNPNTGDVQFVCLERLTPQHLRAQSSPSQSPPSSARPGSSSSASSHSPFSTQATARKRVIYAHSDILTRRSEYFGRMLSSSFSESRSGLPGERKVYTIICQEADFETTYWLLKWIYANWLLFKENDDPRAAVDGIGAGWSAKWLNSRGGEWEWKTFRKSSPSEDSATAARDESRSNASVDSPRSKGEGSLLSGKSKAPTSGTTPPSMRYLPSSRVGISSPSSPSSQKPSANTGISRQPSRRSANTTASSSVSITPLANENAASTSPSRTKSVPIPLSVPKTNYPTPTVHYPLSPHAQRQHVHQAPALSTPDPHPHPTPSPPPASALSMYQVAHRYEMPGLSSLALEHMMSTLTPRSSFSLLLAVSTWDTLRSLVEDYVVDNWAEVSVSEEFEQCCQEIAGGEWGAQGGSTLTGLFRRLRSPAGIAYTRV